MAAALPPQTQLIGNYEVVGVLGTGSVARVLRVTHIPTDTRLVMKIIRKDRIPEAQYAEEGRVMRLIAHRYMARLYEIIESEKEFCLVMDLGPKMTMGDYMRKNGRMREGDVQRIMRKLVSALEYLHGKGIAHKNLTPQNVLYDSKSGLLTIIDFGWCGKASHEDIIANSHGFEAYIAPEMTSRKKAGMEADVWALGVMLYQMIEGKAPFQMDGLGIEGLAHRQLHGEYEPMKRGSGQCHDLVRCMLNPSPRERIGTEALRLHPWIGAGYQPNEGRRDDPHGRLAELKEDIAGAMLSQHARDLVLARMSEMSFDREWVLASVAENRCNQASATFHYLAPKIRNALLGAEKKAKAFADERERAEIERREQEKLRRYTEEMRERAEKVEERRIQRLEREKKLEAARRHRELTASGRSESTRVEAGLQELMRNLEGRVSRRKSDEAAFVEATRTLVDVSHARKAAAVVSVRPPSSAEQRMTSSDPSFPPQPAWESPLGDRYGACIVDPGSPLVRKLLVEPIFGRHLPSDNSTRTSAVNVNGPAMSGQSSASAGGRGGGASNATLAEEEGKEDGGHEETGADFSDAAHIARIKNMESGVFRPPSLMRKGSLIGARMSIAINAIQQQQQQRRKDSAAGQISNAGIPELSRRGSGLNLTTNLPTAPSTPTGMPNSLQRIANLNSANAAAASAAAAHVHAHPTQAVLTAHNTAGGGGGGGASNGGTIAVAQGSTSEEPPRFPAAFVQSGKAMLQQFYREQHRAVQAELETAARMARKQKHDARTVRLAFDSDVATTRLPEVIMDETVRALGSLHIRFRPTDDGTYALDCSVVDKSQSRRLRKQRRAQEASVGGEGGSNPDGKVLLTHVDHCEHSEDSSGEDDGGKECDQDDGDWNDELDVHAEGGDGGRRGLRFIAEVCKLPRPLLHGLRLRKTEGDDGEAQRLFTRLVSSLELS
eukprot:Opistho-2@27016